MLPELHCCLLPEELPAPTHTRPHVFPIQSFLRREDNNPWVVSLFALGTEVNGEVKKTFGAHPKSLQRYKWLGSFWVWTGKAFWFRYNAETKRPWHFYEKVWMFAIFIFGIFFKTAPFGPFLIRPKTLVPAFFFASFPYFSLNGLGSRKCTSRRR